MKVQYPKWLKIGVTAPAVALAILHFAFPIPSERLERVSQEVTDRDGRWMSAFTVDDGTWRLKADLDRVDPVFTERLIAIEDKRFFSHGGVDPIAVIRAAGSWVKAGEPVSGASTLTMQLARQIEPRPRTLRSKVIESFRAVQLELKYSKSEILEYYLTHVSYGGNLDGIRAASLSYYGYEPEQLTDAQISMLIALPQAPEARRPDRRPEAARRGRDIISRKLHAAGHLDARQMAEAIEAPAKATRKPLPQTGWLTAQYLKNDNESSEPIRSTLDKELQLATEHITQDVIAQRPEVGNVAILVVHNPSREVRASVGSADRDLPGGWIDMTRRQRSPGSTLKPFVYALAFDLGLAAPGSRVEDAPTRFGSYQPQNFTRRYHGDVSITEALQHSLNVPAVLALDQIGADRFEGILQGSGVAMTRPVKGKDQGAGLAVALGGLGMSPEGLAMLYSGLANEGQVYPLRWRMDAPTSDKGYQLVGSESAAQITQILRQAPTPPGRVPPWLAGGAAPIAYKTGTSYSHRDAWAAGYTPDWTVIIWMGRADGAPRYGLTGRGGAAPVLYDVFSHLQDHSGSAVFQRLETAPQGLTQVSGQDDTRPQILFPPDEGELYVPVFGAGGQGVSLSARSAADGELSWYVDGQALGDNDKARWYPKGPGSYTLMAVNSLGESARSNIIVLPNN